MEKSSRWNWDIHSRDRLGDHTAARYCHFREFVEMKIVDFDSELFNLVLSADTRRDELVAHEEAPALVRLARTGSFVRQLERLNGIFDTVAATYALDEPPELKNWQEALKREREARVRRYDMLVQFAFYTVRIGSAFMYDLLPTEQGQEVLLLLHGGLNAATDDGLMDGEVAIMKSMFNAVAWHTSTILLERPTWFVTPFDFGGTFGLSRWGNDLIFPDYNDEEKFIAEVATWSKLNHPHIAKFLGACHVGDKPFIAHEKIRPVTEYVSGENVNKPAVWRRMYEVALALQYLHERGLACGDLTVETVYCSQFEDKTVLLGKGLINLTKCSYDDAVSASSLQALALCVVNVLHALEYANQAERIRKRHIYPEHLPLADDKLDRNVFPSLRPEFVLEEEWDLLQLMICIGPNQTKLTILDVIRGFSSFAQLAQRADWCDLSWISQSQLDLSEFTIDVGGVCIPSLCLSVQEVLSKCRDRVKADNHAYLVQLRLEDLLKLLGSLNTLNVKNLSSLEVLQRFASLLVEYDRFVDLSYCCSAFNRSVLSRKATSNVFSIHMAIDNFMQLLNLSSYNYVHSWQVAASVIGSGTTLPLGSNLQESEYLTKEEVACREYEIATYPGHYLSDDPKPYLKWRLPEYLGLQNRTILPRWFIPPHEIGFRTFDSLGKGSFGYVHHGTWFDTPVVIKRVIVDNIRSSEIQQQFRNEADLWFQLNHINIVKMYGACHIGQPFFVCEYASGGNLDAYIDRQGRDPYLIWYCLLNAALGLQYLHDSHIVHGDLKANNILVGADGVAKLADFGLSAMTSEKGKSETGGAIGAFRWKAPECIPLDSDPGEPATAASDIYSFAMCMIEVLSGEYPWGSRMDDKAVAYHVKRGHLPIQPSTISDSEWELIKRMSCLDPGQRVTMDAVVVHLSSVLERIDRTDLFPSLRGEVPRRAFKNHIVARSGTLLVLSQLAKSNNIMLVKHANDHLLTVHLDREAKSERQEIASIVELMTNGSMSAKVWAADALSRLTFHNPTNQDVVIELGGLDPIISWLRDDSNPWKCHAAAVLSHLSMHARNICAVVEAGGVPVLLPLLTGNDTEATEALSALYGLSMDLVYGTQEVIADAGAIPYLVSLLISGDDYRKEMSASILSHLMYTESNRMRVAEAGGIPPLVALLRDGSESQKIDAMHALGGLCGEHSNKPIVVAAGAIPLLVSLLCNGPREQQNMALLALQYLSLEGNNGAIVDAGVIPPLMQMLRADDSSQVEHAVSLLSILAMQVEHTLAIGEAIPEFVQLVRDGDERGLASAILALSNVSDNPANFLRCVDAGCILPLATVVRTGDDSSKHLTVPILMRLAKAVDPDVVNALVSAIPPLVEHARHGPDTEKEDVAFTLSLFSNNEELKHHIAAAGSIPALVAWMNGGSDALKCYAAATFWNLACSIRENRHEIAAAGAISLLVELVVKGTDLQKLSAAGALAFLEIDIPTRVTIAENGGIAILLEYLQLAVGRDKEDPLAALANLSDGGGVLFKESFVNADGRTILSQLLTESDDDRCKDLACLILSRLSDLPALNAVQSSGTQDAEAAVDERSNGLL